ncbi:MAG TPA: non-canonical purine NTP pyrophosphatase, RdgB/HAM1 family [Chitinophagaceae bacterium]|nr:non-canonical purine NTP pyrophosphatase, RdgB/HAM1 family [Chitinophagaceae bacterium]
MSEQSHPLLFATNNSNKALEVNHILGNAFKVLSLKDAGIEIDIAEPHATLEANAREKSMTIYTLKNIDCFSEDTGLEVEALGGAPGVKSARFAGEPSNTEANIKKLLLELQNKENRKAQFRTVISLVQKGVEKQFEGVCKGHITLQPIGENGFGYDPVFIPEGSTKTFAEMNTAEKNEYSHRRKAVEKLVDYLKKMAS